LHHVLALLSNVTATTTTMMIITSYPTAANINTTPATRSSSSTSLDALPRVVVTGMGITSCLGNTLEDVKASLHEAKSGITKSDEFEELGIKSQVRGIPDISEDQFKEWIPKSVLRFCGLNAKYAYVAMERAIKDAGLEPSMYEENPRVATIIGQGGTSIPDIVETVEAVQSGGKRWKNKVGPFRVTRSMGSTCSAVLATAFKTQGPSYSISSACSTGAHCIGTGMEQIQLGKADMCFVGAGTLPDCCHGRLVIFVFS
jgi:3-oxoacyl-[acyl-carrier-protein] synthase I